MSTFIPFKSPMVKKNDKKSEKCYFWVTLILCRFHGNGLQEDAGLLLTYQAHVHLYTQAFLDIYLVDHQRYAFCNFMILAI